MHPYSHVTTATSIMPTDKVIYRDTRIFVALRSYSCVWLHRTELRRSGVHRHVMVSTLRVHDVFVWQRCRRRRRRQGRAAAAAAPACRSSKTTASGKRSTPAVRSVTWSWWSRQSSAECDSVAASIQTSTSAALPTCWRCSTLAAPGDRRASSSCRTRRFTSSRPVPRTSSPTSRPATSASTVIDTVLRPQNCNHTTSQSVDQSKQQRNKSPAR